MDKIELQNLVQNNFNDIADILDIIYLSFHNNESNVNYEDIIKVLEDFNFLLNEYVNLDKEFDVNLVIASIKKLLTLIENKDTILLNDVLRFEFQEYLQIMFEYLEEN